MTQGQQQWQQNVFAPPVLFKLYFSSIFGRVIKPMIPVPMLPINWNDVRPKAWKWSRKTTNLRSAEPNKAVQRAIVHLSSWSVPLVFIPKNRTCLITTHNANPSQFCQFAIQNAWTPKRQTAYANISINEFGVVRERYTHVLAGLQQLQSPSSVWNRTLRPFSCERNKSSLTWVIFLLRPCRSSLRDLLVHRSRMLRGRCVICLILMVAVSIELKPAIFDVPATLRLHRLR